ncbi:MULTISPECIES: ABC transporter permease [Ancylobacter]|uniref:Peptide/nickel transport system permease protein n=2 Tax=Ancylobacter TaxID=99 RepID=A0A839ZFJ5_9HYPH|nr:MULTISPECIES: ABC transporter permease [Ancylobacter]MBB3773559.1 peptide/nickel transport system permease protein [Ancylobacter tetraedralis]MDQ0512900.1 peptide/nickel transport system permease protein [Ancylobacter amanitiformis]
MQRHSPARTLARLGATVSSLAITLFGLVLVTFFIGRVIPIDPVLTILGDHARPELVERMRIELGLDKPLPVQFWIYLTHLFRGDLGRSVMTSNLVVDDIKLYFPATVELGTTAMIFATLIGIPLGVLSAVRRNSRLDQFVRVFSIVGHSIPIPVLGLISLLVFYAWLGWAPGTGRVGVAYVGMTPTVTGFLTVDALIAGDADVFWDALSHLMLPAAVLAYFSMAYISRMTRAFMIDALAGEYVITARAKGLSPARVIWRHAFGNIAVRLATVLALTYAGLLEGAVVTEMIFSWPGIGQYLTVSLLNADMNAVIGATLLVGFVYMVLNLLADVAYRVLDPRV